MLSVLVTQLFNMSLKIDPYNGDKDPEDHLKRLLAAMENVGMKDPQRCRIFTSTLIDITMEWYMKLPSASIHCFADLSEQFLWYFANSYVSRKTYGALVGFIENWGNSERLPGLL